MGRGFELDAMLTCEPVHPRSARFGDAIACNRIDLLITLSLTKKGNARMKSLRSELKSEIYYVGNQEADKILQHLFNSMNQLFGVLVAEIGAAAICIGGSQITH
jgi:hypothetical protein